MPELADKFPEERRDILGSYVQYSDNLLPEERSGFFLTKAAGEVGANDRVDHNMNRYIENSFRETKSLTIDGKNKDVFIYKPYISSSVKNEDINITI